MPGGIRWQARIKNGSKLVLGRVWLTTKDGTERVALKQSTSSKPIKKGDVLLTGKRKDGTRMNFRVYRTNKGKPKITMTGQPPVSDALTGVKLRLYGSKKDWLTLPSDCKRMTFSSNTRDAYGDTKSATARRACKS